MTNSMVMVNTAIVVRDAGVVLRESRAQRLADGPMVSAIRYSIVIFLAGNAIGGYMLARGAHTVGTATAAPAFPL